MAWISDVYHGFWGPWLLFGGVVVLMLALDLGVFHRRPHVVALREAITWSVVWVLISLGFGGWVYAALGPQKGIEFVTGYMVEKSLSVDNLFIFVLIFGQLKIPPRFQHRVLFWGILGAILLRGVFIGLGAHILERYGFVLDLFGVLLVYTGAKLLLTDDDEENWTQRVLFPWMQRRLPFSNNHESAFFFERVSSWSPLEKPQPDHGGAGAHVDFQHVGDARVADQKISFGGWQGTPLLMALLMVEISDVIFAMDSIPAVFAITLDPFVVYSANIFAILGLRSLYFVLSHAVSRWTYLQSGLGVILCFVGVKIFVRHIFPVPVLVSLMVIVGVLLVTAFLSWRKNHQE